MTKKHILIGAALTLFSLTLNASVIFGPETFNTPDGNLKTVVRNITLGDNQPGTYLVKLQNGSNGPDILPLCANKPTVELRRQCQ